MKQTTLIISGGMKALFNVILTPSGGETSALCPETFEHKDELKQSVTLYGKGDEAWKL